MNVEYKIKKDVLSIVIVNLNGIAWLKDCLPSVEGDNYDSKEIVVVDNGSSDESVKYIKENHKQIILIQNDENKGFSKANNQGILATSGEFIILLNNDTKVIENGLCKSVEYLKDHKEISMMCPKILNKDLTQQRGSIRRIPNLFHFFMSALKLDTVFINNGIFNHMCYGSFQYDKIIPIDQPMGAAMIFRRSILDNIGGAIDERFFIYYDDVDIAKRVKDKGLKTTFYPEAKIIHYGGGDSGKIPRKTIRNLSSSKFKFVLKHYGLYSTFLLLLIEIIRLIRIVILTPVYLAIGRKPKIWWNIQGVFRSFFLVIGNYGILKQKQNLDYDYMMKNKLF